MPRPDLCSTAAALLLAALLLAGCAAPKSELPPAPPPPALVPPPAKQPGDASVLHYRCDNRTEFSVRFTDDTALLDLGALGNDTLLRDAGGVTPQQSVFSNARVRAEFGLGPATKEAVLHFLAPAQDVRCARD